MSQAPGRCCKPTGRQSLLGAAVLLLTAACSDSEAAQVTGRDDGSAQPLQVYAAASLSHTFAELGEKFEDTHGVEVAFNFAGSTDLAAQIEQGAPAEIFASADEPNMERAQQSGATATEPELFAANTLVIVTPPGNPAAIHTLEDLAGDQVITVTCAPQVPCGSATAEIAEAAEIELAPASEENAVTDVLGKVRSGEADAGLVYRTDALGAGDDVNTIDFEGSEDVVNHYPIAVIGETDTNEAARDFIEFIRDPEAQQTLSDAGFAAP